MTSTDDKPHIEAIEDARTTRQPGPETFEISNLDDDPHRLALEDNPVVADSPSWSTILAVLVKSSLSSCWFYSLTRSSFSVFHFVRLLELDLLQ